MITLTKIFVLDAFRIGTWFRSPLGELSRLVLLPFFNVHLLVLTWPGFLRQLASVTAATMSGMLAVVKGRTSELLVSFVRFGLGESYCLDSSFYS